MLSCGKPQQTSEEKKAKNANKRIEEDIENKKKQTAFKILLLGTGDSGKSTFIKQMGYIYGTHTKEDLAPFTSVLRDNCLDAMQVLLSNLESNGGIPEAVKPLTTSIQQADFLNPTVANAITTLWNNKQLQSCLTVAHGTNIQGGVNGAKFYFDNAKRFADPEFIPTKDDTLMARRKTVGIAETNFNYNGTYFTLVDVGGQRSERKKWLHCFNSVTAVIFLTAINEYDMVLEEDATTNRLLESLKLWKALTGSTFFKNTPFILFLNKSDLFEAKIALVPLKDVFTDFEKVTGTPEYSKYDTMAKSWRYILKQFSSQFEGCSFHPHLTNVLDTELCRKVFIVLQDTIIQETMNVF